MRYHSVVWENIAVCIHWILNQTRISKVRQITTESLWGIDLGGTKIEGVILKSAAEPEVLFRDRVPTESDQGYEHILHQVKTLVDTMCDFAQVKPSRIGVGTPGVHDPRLGTMKNCN